MKNIEYRFTRGFTLIELMVVVIIIAIIFSIGLPSYSQYIIESQRNDAKGRLVALEARMQRFWANSGRTYANAATALGLPDSSDANYTYSVVIAANGAGIANQAFTLTATATGSQVNDTGCTTLTVDNTGAKTPVACW